MNAAARRLTALHLIDSKVKTEMRATDLFAEVVTA